MGKLFLLTVLLKAVFFLTFSVLWCLKKKKISTAKGALSSWQDISPVEQNLTSNTDINIRLQLFTNYFLRNPCYWKLLECIQFFMRMWQLKSFSADKTFNKKKKTAKRFQSSVICTYTQLSLWIYSYMKSWTLSHANMQYV